MREEKPVSETNDLVKDFLVESHENLDQLDRDLVVLEQDPSSQDTLASIFRTIHTLKGTCGFLGFGKLESVAHVGENLLSRLRDGELSVSADITSGLLALVDAVRYMLAAIETDGVEGEDDFAGLVDTLIQLQEDALSGRPQANPRKTEVRPHRLNRRRPTPNRRPLPLFHCRSSRRQRRATRPRRKPPRPQRSSSPKRRASRCPTARSASTSACSIG
jgi:chemotaxis protein histidine kinase CheA